MSIINTHNDKDSPKKLNGFKRTNLIKRVSRLCSILIIAYLVLLAFLYFKQDDMIFPGASTQGNKEYTVASDPGKNIDVIYINERNKLPIIFEKPQKSKAAGLIDSNYPVMIFFYGNGSTAKDSYQLFEKLRANGINVVIPEYIGYGINSGKPSEINCYKTASQTYTYLTQTLNIPPSKIVIAGWSLGAAPAIYTASKYPCAGLVTFSAFTSMLDMSHKDFPIVPKPLLKLMLNHPFMNINRIGSVNVPILSIHSKDDEVVPYYMNNALCAKVKAPLERLALHKFGHNEFMQSTDPNVNDILYAFIARVTGTRDLPMEKRLLVYPRQQKQ